MSGWAYYNEIDPYAAQWLRNLIDAGHIAPGVVDTRSIEDVHPIELRGFTQCHFFAGVGVWSRALRLAGWPDDRPVWTGSCPCQPFSAAGKGAGFADERHLWPAWFHLIGERRPAAIFGEQVASKAGGGDWVDLVQDDMEGLGYPFAAAAFPSAGVGAPHIRDRLYWVAEEQRAFGVGHEAKRAIVRGGGSGTSAAAARGMQGANGERQWIRADIGSGSAVAVERRAAGFVGDASSAGLAQRVRQRGIPSAASGADARQAIKRAGLHPGGLADDDDDDGRQQRLAGLRLRGSDLHDADGRGPLGGFWADAEWIACRDGKWRPVEPGTFPLAHGAPARVGRLRAYGNAINAEAARAFVESYLDGEFA